MRAKGRTYENMVGRKLKRRIQSGELKAELVEHQWFWFTDDNGPGYCQTDYYLICQGFIILIECKLTQTDTAYGQMYKLYAPILQHIYGCPVVCVQVCKNMRTYARTIKDIETLIHRPEGGMHIWHFLG